MKVFCKKCKEWIGEFEILKNGQPRIKEPTKKFLSVRYRQDGEYGFQCKCGNYSLLAKAEEGVIKQDGKPPTPEGVAEITKRLDQGLKSQPKITNQGREIDNFIYKEI
jgi:hypothetical protein